MRATRIILATLAAAAASVILNYVGWRFVMVDTWSFWTDFVSGMVMGLVLIGSWACAPWFFRDFPFMDPDICYVVGAVGWAAFGLIIGILGEMRRKGYELFIQPGLIILCFPVAYVFIVGLNAIASLCARVWRLSSVAPVWDIAKLLEVALIQIPALLAILTLVDALARGSRGNNDA